MDQLGSYSVPVKAVLEHTDKVGNLDPGIKFDTNVLDIQRRINWFYLNCSACGQDQDQDKSNYSHHLKLFIDPDLAAQRE